MAEIEYELKVLDVDPAKTAEAIVAAGGRSLGDRLMRRRIYPLPGKDRWLRLRDEGTKVTLCLKHVLDEQRIGGVHEIETVVGDFDTAHELLAALGHEATAYQENRRSSYQLGPARLEVDSWPWIPPYLEIEADTAEAVEAAARLLGYGAEQLTAENTFTIYARYGIDLNAVADLRFTTETDSS